MLSKRILSYFLVIVMLFTILSPQAFAADDMTNGQSYDEESFYNVFTDREFGKQVLKAIGVDINNIDWSLVNDNSLGSIKELQVINNIKNINGLEKLKGLERLVISETGIDKFPDEIEKNLTNLKSLSLGNSNNKPIKIPAFANLTEFSTLSGQAVTIDSKEAIESMSNLKTLNLTRSNISDSNSIAKVIDYSKFKNLQNLNISHNNIEVLPESIKVLSSIDTFDISSNNISSVTNGYFDNMKNIKSIRMNNCKFNSIPEEIFTFTNLTNLDMSYNYITSLEANTDVLNLCTSLNLGGNKIKDFSSDYFNSFPNLKYLNLNFCGLDKLPESITNLKSLYSLDLVDNPIGNNKDTLNYISWMESLNSLNLSQCGINEFPEAILGLQDLTSLNLSNNAIKKIPDGDNGIKKLADLCDLNLSNCQLNEFPAALGDLANLQYLYISDNNISKFPQRDIIEGKFKNLYCLNMDNCNITEFPDIKCFPNIVDLHLDNNLIYDIPDNTDISGMVNGYIGLTFNYLTSIPKSFIDNTSNVKINFYSNYIPQNPVSQYPGNIIDTTANQLMFHNMPSYLFAGQSLDLYEYLARKTSLYSPSAEIISKIKNFVPLEFTVSKDGSKKEGLIDENGNFTSKTEPGVYLISAKPKNAAESNLFAKATATINILDENSLYNEDRFKVEFPDEAFRLELLKALKAIDEDAEVINYESVLWDRVNDGTLSSLRELEIHNQNVSELTGLDKLSGLEELSIRYSKINEFPVEIENKLTNIKTLSITGNEKAITIPKFASLTNLVCGDMSGQALTGVQNITKESIDSINSMTNLKMLSLNNAKDVEENVVLADSIDYTKFPNLEKLCISDNGFTDLPEGIETLKNLVSIDLSYNNLNSIPDYFATSFKNLSDLYLNSCKFDSFPKVISKISTLNNLIMGRNDLKEIPREVASLENLILLSIEDCGLTAFPEGILGLQKLQRLSLSGNLIKRFPSDMSKMQSLRGLDLSFCGLDKFPEEVLSIESLSSLILRENYGIKAVPVGINGIGRLEALSFIDLTSCGLNTVPDFNSCGNLFYITLDNNNICEIPDDFDLSNTNVEIVSFADNNLTSIPELIIADAKNRNCSYDFSNNYIQMDEGTSFENINNNGSKQIAFDLELPIEIEKSTKLDLKEYIKIKTWYGMASDKRLDTLVEYSYVDSHGNQKTVENGVLYIEKPGTYTVKGIVKGAESSNTNAIATVNLTVVDAVTPTVTPTETATPTIDGTTTPSATTTPTPAATQASQGNQGGGGGAALQASTPTPTATVTATVTPTQEAVTKPGDEKKPAADGKGIEVKIDKDKTIVDVKAGDDYIAQMTKNKICKIDLSDEINTENCVVNIPESFLKNLDLKGGNEIQLITPSITVSFNIKEFVLKDIKELSLTLGKMPQSGLTKEQKGVTGASDVVRITFVTEDIGGEKAVLKKSKNPILITLPYESTDSNEYLTLISLGFDGEIENLAAKYDKDSETITAKTRALAPVCVINNSIQYNDIKKGSWSQVYIEAMSAKGIVKGYEKGIFKPELNITRAEFASIIARLLKLESNGSNISFTDIKEDAWYRNAVIAAAEARIITGWKGKFNTNDRITREDAAVMISRALTYADSQTDDNTGELTFKDRKKISLYAEEHIRFVVGKKIMSGKSNNLFDPKGYTTRAEVAKMAYMLFEQL